MDRHLQRVPADVDDVHTPRIPTGRLLKELKEKEAHKFELMAAKLAADQKSQLAQRSRSAGEGAVKALELVVAKKVSCLPLSLSSSLFFALSHSLSSALSLSSSLSFFLSLSLSFSLFLSFFLSLICSLFLSVSSSLSLLFSLILFTLILSLSLVFLYNTL